MNRKTILASSLLCLSGALALAANAIADADAKTPGPKVGDDAPAIALKTPKGDKVELAELVKKQPVIVLFLRGYPGYQCPICTRQVADYVGHADQIKAAGARVLMVYPGPAEGLAQRAIEFTRDTKLPDNFDFVIDPGYTATNAWNLRWDAEKETAYPSTFVVGTDGKITYAKVSTSHGDRSDPAEVIKTMKAKK